MIAVEVARQLKLPNTIIFEKDATLPSRIKLEASVSFVSGPEALPVSVPSTSTGS